ncbi:MAG: hypothetical protein FJ405_11865, partial [Verrucomicrobia bacterium]|nr:hypothetical protein [Verrucomicrobiota bacterium]
SPGWYRANPHPGQRAWIQTRPRYSIGQGEASLLIRNTNAVPLPIVSVSVLSDYVGENGYDAGVVVFSIPEPLTRDLVVAYATEGTAEPGVDYVRLTGSVTINAGSTVGLLSIFSVPNTQIDGNRTVVVTAAENPAYQTRDDEVTVVIADDDLPSVWVTAPQSQAMEDGSRLGAFRITRTGSILESLGVSYLLRGDATNGIDFNLLSGSAVIPAGQDSVVIPVVPRRDQALEAAETVTLQIASAPTYNIVTPSSASIVILDESTPIVSIAPPAAGVFPNESGGGQASFTLSRSGPTSRSLLVRYEVGGTAHNGNDYRSIGSSIIMPAGAATVQIPITGIADDITEWIEHLTVRLQPGSGYLVNPFSAEASARFESDGGAQVSIGFEAEFSEIRESEEGLEIGIHLSGPPQFNITNWVAEVRVVGGSGILSNDFIFTATNSRDGKGFISFDHYNRVDRGANQIVLTTNIHLTMLDNQVKQKNRSVLLGLFYPQISFTNIALDPASGTLTTNTFTFPTNWIYRDRRFHWVTIIDDDASVVSVQAPSPLAYESGLANGAFRIFREGTNGFAEPVRISYEIRGSAGLGADYEPITRFATIPAGAEDVLVPIVAVDDQTYEGPESVQIKLLFAEGSSIHTNAHTATITIVDDDGTIQFSKLEHRIVETIGTFQLPVIRNGSVGLRQTIRYTVQPGNATPGVDYVAQDGELTFEPGETAKTIPIQIINDSEPELPEVINIALALLDSGVASGGQTRARIVIESEDSGFVFSTDRLLGAEYDSGIPIRIIRTGTQITDGSVRLTTRTLSGDSAVLGQDYSALNEQILFPAGVTERTVSLPLINDSLIEGDEVLTVELSDAQGGGLTPSTSVAKAVIREDDSALEFSALSFTAFENQRVARLSVRRLGGTLNAVAVNYRTADLTARNGLDYISVSNSVALKGEEFVRDTAGSGGLLLSPGQASATVEIPLVDDAVGEQSEMFTVTLSGARTMTSGRPPGSTTLGQNVQASVVILDNELPGNPDAEYGSGLRFTALDPSNPNRVGDAVNAIGVQPDGRVVIAGDFTEVNDYTLRHIARLDPLGRLDLGFNPGIGSDGTVLDLEVLSDGRIYLAGTFTNVAGSALPGVARLNADGSLDSSFAIGQGTLRPVRALAVEEGGSVLVGGDFVIFNNQPRQRLARLNASGVVQPGFTPEINGPVHAIAVQDDGRILIGGSFTTVNRAPRNGIARLNANGSLDAGFNPGSGVDSTVLTIGITPSGDILIGGAFTSVNDADAFYFARLLPNGAHDPSFASGGQLNAAVRSISVHRSGKIYIAGDFTEIGSVQRNFFARLRLDGSVDPSFDIGAGADGTVRTILAAPNTAAYIGGEFHQVNGLSRPRFARIHGDEKLTLTGVEFVTPQLTVSEGIGRVRMQVRRTGDTNLPFTVDYESVPLSSTAIGGLDYLTVKGTLTFPAGVNAQSFDVTIVDDQIVELPESLVLRLSSRSSAVDLSGTVIAEIRIIDNEAAISLSTTNIVVAESDASFTFGLVRQQATNSEVSVTVALEDLTATGGRDYGGSSLRVTFAPGEVSKSVTIPILEDRLAEGPEQLRIRLTDPTGNVAVGIGVAIVTITDNDFDRIEFVAFGLVSEQNGNGSIDPS